MLVSCIQFGNSTQFPPAVLPSTALTGRDPPPTGCAKTSNVRADRLSIQSIPYLFLANHFSIKVTRITKGIR